MKRLVLCIAVLATPAQAAELSADQLHLLVKDLNDPESARLRNVRKSSIFDGVICGEVNWRNEMGGFGGYRKFWLDQEDQKAAIDPDLGYSLFADSLGCEPPTSSPDPLP